jgi:hypothetical protein
MPGKARVSLPVPVTRIVVTYRVGSSLFLSGVKVQWHTLSRRFAYVEIEIGLYCAVLTVSPSRTKLCMASSWCRFASLPEALSVKVLSRTRPK